MQNEITTFRCGGSTANAEQPGKRRDITRWRESRRRRLACIKQPTEIQLARSEMLARQLDAEQPNDPSSATATGGSRGAERNDGNS